MADIPDLTDVLEFVSPSAEWIEALQPELPDHWRNYASQDRETRLGAAMEEIADLSSLFPLTEAALKSNITDAYIVRCSDSVFGGGILRIFNLTVEDSETTCWISRPPVAPTSAELKHPIFEKAPKALANVYVAKFDGFASMFGTGGLLPLRSVVPITDSELEEADWFEDVALRTDKKLVFELANNGGGVHALIDLSKDQSMSDSPTLIWVDDDDGLEKMSTPLWSFLDSMMEITASG